MSKGSPQNSARLRLWLASAFFFVSAIPGAGATDGPVALATVSDSASITLDGRLDEPIWRNTPVIKLVRQAPSREDTGIVPQSDVVAVKLRWTFRR